MTFDEILTHVLELLQRQGRVSYRALKRRFAIDDEYLEDLKAELIKAQRLATDEDGDVLVWAGGDRPPPLIKPEPSSSPAVIHANVFGREDPHVQSCPRRGTQAGHRPIR